LRQPCSELSYIQRSLYLGMAMAAMSAFAMSSPS
jgi:hypothetical protein